MEKSKSEKRIIEEPNAFLEIHFYREGLRAEPLGNSANARPIWAPPHDWVGFRNDFPLELGDFVVEFSRIKYKENYLNWIAVFAASTDEVFGDRRNHIGVGVWLNGLDIQRAGLLLQALRQFCEDADPTNLESLHEGAREFVTKDYLYQYLRSRVALPPGLSGWSFGTNPLAETELFSVTGDEKTAWKRVSNQILKVNLLPGPTEEHSRCLMLVSKRATEKTLAPPLNDQFQEEIVKAIPQQFVELCKSLKNAEATRDELNKRLMLANTNIEIYKKEITELTEKSESLSKILDENESTKATILLVKKVENMEKIIAGIDRHIIDFSRSVGDKFSFLNDKLTQQKQMQNNIKEFNESNNGKLNPIPKEYGVIEIERRPKTRKKSKLDSFLHNYLPIILIVIIVIILIAIIIKYIS